jgi:hypothetical protein
VTRFDGAASTWWLNTPLRSGKPRSWQGASETTHRFIAGLAKSLRAYTMEKPPSVSEMNDVALAMQVLGIEQIRPEHKDIMLPLIAKTEGDRKRLLMKQAFESIVRIAGRYASEISPEEEPDLDAILVERAEA